MTAINKSLFEDGYDIHPCFWEQDANTDITGDWFRLAGLYDKCYFLFHKAGTEDVDNLGIHILQATDNAAGGVKLLNIRKLWYKTGTMTGQGLWTAKNFSTPGDVAYFGASAPSAGTYTVVQANQIVADVNTAAVSVLVEVLAEHLDINNGFNHVTAFMEGDDVDNTCLFSCLFLGAASRFPQGIPLDPTL